MYDIIDYGATKTKKSINTKAIQAAIDACSEAGGGTVYCPSGIFYTGTIWLKNNVTLYLDNGCELKACTDKKEYNQLDCFPEHDVVAHQNANGKHLIIAYQVDNIAITGNGRINGNCKAFFTDGKFERKDVPGQYMYNLPKERPGQMLYFCRCTNIQIKDIAMDDACFWTVYMLGCENVKISGINIKVLEVPNGDGLHFNCCRNIIISDCNIDSQDDCFIFRGYYQPLGENIPCENVVVTNCLLKSMCCAFRIGVGDGVIRNCHFSNIVIYETRQGINFMPAYSERYPRGTDIDNVNFSNITMDVKIPLYMANCGKANLRNINFSGLKVNMTQAIVISGDSNNKYNDITISDSVFNVQEGLKRIIGKGSMYVDIPSCSIFIKNTDSFKFLNSQIKYLENAEKVDQVVNIINCVNPQINNVDFCNYDKFAKMDISIKEESAQ